MPVYKLEVENRERDAQQSWTVESPSSQAARAELIVALKRAAGDTLRQEGDCSLIGRLEDLAGNEIYTAKLSLQTRSADKAAR